MSLTILYSTSRIRITIIIQHGSYIALPFSSKPSAPASKTVSHTQNSLLLTAVRVQLPLATLYRVSYICPIMQGLVPCGFILLASPSPPRSKN